MWFEDSRFYLQLLMQSLKFIVVQYVQYNTPTYTLHMYNNYIHHATHVTLHTLALLLPNIPR